MWSVKTDSGSTVYTGRELADMLISRVMANQPKEHQEQISKQFIDMMAEHIADTSPRTLFDTGLRLGYLYRIFMEKNNVTYEAASAPTSTPV